MFDLHGHPPRFLKLAFRVEIRFISPGDCQVGSVAYGGVDSMPICYIASVRKKKMPFLKLTFAHLKMDGWKTSFLLGCPISSAMLALGSVHP